MTSCKIDSLNYLQKYQGNDECFEVPSNVVGIYCNAFADAITLKKIILPESVLYCVGEMSTLISDSITEIVIKNAMYAGTFEERRLPALQRVDVLDADPLRVSNSGRLISSITASDKIQLYFPNVNLYAFNRYESADIKVCAKYLASLELYSYNECLKFDAYIAKHTGRLLKHLVDKKEVSSLRLLLAKCKPKDIEKYISEIQDLQDTELTAVALDLICQNPTDSKPTGNSFDLSFLSDMTSIFSDTVETQPIINDSTPLAEVKKELEKQSGFEISGIEDNSVVLGIFTGDTLGFVYPSSIGDYEVEAIGAPRKSPGVNAVVAVVSEGITAILANSMLIYKHLQAVYIPESVQYIDDSAFHSSIHKDTIFYCYKDSYADLWAKLNKFKTKEPSSLVEDVKKLLAN